MTPTLTAGGKSRYRCLERPAELELNSLQTHFLTEMELVITRVNVMLPFTQTKINSKIRNLQKS